MSVDRNARSQPLPRIAALAAVLLASQLFGATGAIDGGRRGSGGGPTALALDERTGRRFVGLWNDQTVVEWRGGNQGGGSTILATGHRPTRLEWSPRHQALFFTCYYADHLCVIPRGRAGSGGESAARCFAPGAGSPENRAWEPVAGAHHSIPHPDGGFHGHVESFTLDDDSDLVYVLASHTKGIGMDKDFLWLSAVRWNGERVESALPGLDIHGPSHDHDAFPMLASPSAGFVALAWPGLGLAMRFDPGLRGGSAVAVERLPVALAFDRSRHALWLGDGLGGDVVELDADTLDVRRRIRRSSPISALFLDERGGLLWMVSAASDRVEAIRTEDAAQCVSVEVVKPVASAFDASRRALWVSSLADGGLHEIRADEVADRGCAS